MDRPMRLTPIVGGGPEQEALAAADRELEEKLAEIVEFPTAVEQSAPIQPVLRSERSDNVFRPHHLDDVIGQDHAKTLMKRMIDNTVLRNRPLAHVLLVAASGLGKTTFANVIAEELGVDVYQVEAPISADTLLQLREVMQYGDVLFIDEIHQQAVQERRGRETSTQPEVLFSVMEDRKILTPAGMLPFPEITVIGATTDEGMLPDPFVNRFPIRPHLEPYSDDELAQIVFWNARTIGLAMTEPGARLFARASRGVPRQINNYVTTAELLTTSVVDSALAHEVLAFNRVTEDGLTADMQAVLTFLYTRCRRENKADGEIRYQASVGTIATAIGKSRDQKAISLRIEPYLITQGYLQVGSGGRLLTDAGVQRARQLLHGGTP